MKNIKNERNTWHLLGLKKCVKIATILLSLLLSTTGISETVNTGNLLDNSGFDNGSTSSWTKSSNMGTHTNISIGGGNDGGSLAPTHNSWVEQTISLKDKSQMLEEEIQSGFTSTMSSDVWFWTTDTDTVTIKQTLVDNNNNSSTTNRIIEGTCATFNGCSYTNYTDSIIIGSSDATDYNITARVDVTDGGQSTGHAAPDVDDIELSVAYTKYEPISEDIQEDLDVIDDIDFDYEEIDFTTPIIEDDFYWEEFETVWFDDFEEFEEFEETAFEDLEIPEEFEEFFDDFSEEEMEIIEEEFADEFTDEIMDEVVEEETTNKEVVKEDKEEVIEEETADEETEVAENKSEEETTEKIEEENDTIDTPEEETETEILTEEKEIDVAETKDNKINIEVNKNVSVEVKQISLFDNGNELTAYQETDFYQPENIYADVDNALFIQADLSIYNKGIYLNIGLDNYISTDPIGQHKQKLYEIKVNKIQLMIELNKLKELL